MELIEQHREALVSCIMTVRELLPENAFNRVHYTTLLELIQGCNFLTGEVSQTITKMLFIRSIEKRYWDEVHKEARVVLWNGYEQLRRLREDDKEQRVWTDERVSREMMVMYELSTHIAAMEHVYLQRGMFPGLDALA